MEEEVYLPSDKELEAALAELQLYVQSQELLKTANLSDSFLKRVLWAKHCKQKSSQRLLTLYVDWHVKHLGSASARLSITHVHAFLLTGVLQVPPGAKDKDGRHVVYMRPNMYRPGKIPANHVINALVYLLDFLTSDPDELAAKYGFTFVCDMKGWGWSNFGTSYASQFFNILSGRFPVRIRKFVLVNAPSMFPLVWKIIKPMMSVELASKFTFVTNDTISSVLDTQDWLPLELGGSKPSMDMPAFVKAQYEREGLPFNSAIDVETVNWKAP